MKVYEDVWTISCQDIFHMLTDEAFYSYLIIQMTSVIVSI